MVAIVTSLRSSVISAISTTLVTTDRVLDLCSRSEVYIHVSILYNYTVVQKMYHTNSVYQAILSWPGCKTISKLIPSSVEC